MLCTAQPEFHYHRTTSVYFMGNHCHLVPVCINHMQRTGRTQINFLGHANDVSDAGGRAKA